MNNMQEMNEKENVSYILKYPTGISCWKTVGHSTIVIHLIVLKQKERIYQCEPVGYYDIPKSYVRRFHMFY